MDQSTSNATPIAIESRAHLLQNVFQSMYTLHHILITDGLIVVPSQNSFEFKLVMNSDHNLEHRADDCNRRIFGSSVEQSVMIS